MLLFVASTYSLGACSLASSEAGSATEGADIDELTTEPSATDQAETTIAVTDTTTATLNIDSAGANRWKVGVGNFFVSRFYLFRTTFI